MGETRADADIAYVFTLDEARRIASNIATAEAVRQGKVGGLAS